jgi:glycosyltransferase involved in cell wall biosynthesis
MNGHGQPISQEPRIAFFFSTSGHSGVDRAVSHLLPAITRRGYPVDLLHVRKHGPSIEDVPQGVRVVDLGTRHTYAALPEVARYLRRVRPAVMLSDKDRVNRIALFARILARSRTRLVFSSGTTISVDLAHRGALERWVQRNSMGRLYPLAEGVIVTCAGVADDMAAYTGLARERIQVVASPVIPASLFTEPQPRPDHPWFAPGGAPVILGMGELGMRKDFPTLLRAFAQLRRTRPCRLVILGRGRQREELLTLARSLGVEDDFDLPGFQPNPYAWLAHAALFAFTSLWEGLGFALIEALAVGTPVVATDCPSGPREILQDGRIGHLVQPGDARALAAAMAETLAHPLEREVLQEAARPYEIERSTSAYLRALGLAPRERDAGAMTTH